MIKGWKQLTKKEREHLAEMKVVTTFQLDDCLELQAKWRKENPEGLDPCWTCRGIAQKLGKVI